MQPGAGGRHWGTHGCCGGLSCHAARQYDNKDDPARGTLHDVLRHLAYVPLCAGPRFHFAAPVGGGRGRTRV
jgi:hypothetical protein